MNYEAVELELVSRLEASTELSAIADIVVLPEAIDKYKIPVINGLVTVVFMGESFDKNQSVGQISQHSTVTFNISIQSRRLRGAKGVYAISELIKQSLMGFIPTDCGMISLGDFDYVNYQNDVWEYSLAVACRSLRTQIHPHFVDAPVTDDQVYYQPK